MCDSNSDETSEIDIDREIMIQTDGSQDILKVTHVARKALLADPYSFFEAIVFQMCQAAECRAAEMYLERGPDNRPSEEEMRSLASLTLATMTTQLTGIQARLRRYSSEELY